MANVTGASLNPILEQLNETPSYHPFNAETFADWSLEAGDVIKIRRGTEEYDSPVHTSKMVWKGTPSIQLNSTGNREREAVSKVSRKKYGRGSAGVRSQEGIYRDFTSPDGLLHSELAISESRLRTEFDDVANSLRSEFEMTASHLRTEFTNDVYSLRGEFEVTASHLRTEFADDVYSLRGELQVTASHLRTDFSDEVNSVRSYMQQTASSWDARVEGVVDSNGKITAASICVAINDDESNATIEADKIYLLGQTIADTVTANYIYTQIQSLSTLLANKIDATEIEAGDIKVRPIAGMSPLSVSAAYSGSNLTLTGNTYKLTLVKLNGQYDEWTFSRATTLSAGWDGNRTFTVGANPQGVERYTTLVSAVPNANVSWSGTVGTITLKATIDDGETTVSVGDVTMDVANFLEDKTGTNKITSNGTYIPSTGKLGFSGIEIDVPNSGSGTTTLSNTWNSGHLVVNASPQGVSLERWLSAAGVSWNGNVATVPINALWGNSQQYSESTGWNVTVDASAKVTSAGYAGRAAVTISNTLSWTTTPASGITVNQNAVTVTTTGRTNSSGTEEQSTKTINLYSQVGSWGTPSTNKCYVYITHTDSTNGNRIIRREVDASSLVTNAGYAGSAAVTLSNPSWNTVSSIGANRTVTVSTTGRTNSNGETDNLSKSVALYITQGSWSNENKLEVSMRTGSTGGTVVAKSVVDASSRVTSAGYAGRAAVNLAEPTWNAVSGSTPTSRTVTVTTTGRTTNAGVTDNVSRSISLYLTQGNWSNKKKTVFMRQGTTSGTVYAQTDVDATSIYNDGYDANTTSWLYEQSTGSIAGNLNPGIWVTAGYRDHNNTVHYCGSRWYTLKAGGVRVHSGAEPSGVQTLASNTVYEVYYDNGSGGTPGSGKYFKTPSSGQSYSHSASLYCYEISTGSSGVKTCRFSVQYSATQSVPFSTGHSYSMHW